MIGVRLYLPPRIVNAKIHFFGIVQIFDINIIFNEIWVSSEQGSPKIGAAGLVAGHPSLICGELHHPSGLQGKRFVRCRIGFTCCKEGFEDNLEKLQKAGFPHMQTQGGTCLPSGTSPHADADAGSFREFRREWSGILEAMTLASPVGMGRSMLQAHRRIG